MCIFSLKCTLQAEGRPIFHSEGETSVGCGKCHECISLRASDWAIRCSHEIGSHDDNCCVTLTYDSANLPSIFDRKHEFQKFMKRLRKRSKKKIRYFTSHEFGSDTKRLHHHVLLFGISFPDMQYYKTTEKGTKLFTSKSLDSTWGLGWANIGEANAKAAFYIASYALKRHSFEVADSSGELHTFKDDMNCSGGIGLSHLHRHYRTMALRGDRFPRYYLKKMKEFVTLPKTNPQKFLKIFNHDKPLYYLMKDMYSYVPVIESHIDPIIKHPSQQLAKLEIHRAKLSQDGTFRKKLFTKEDNFRYKSFKHDVLSSITLEIENG